MQEKLNIRMLKHTAPDHGRGPAFLSREETQCVRALHSSLPDYRPTPLVRLDALANRLGVGGIYVKDESKRFGLNAFKGLGGLYALFRVACRELELDETKLSFADLQAPELREKLQKLVFVTATDGNHGRGVAWAAGKLGCSSHVYMPRGSSERRAQAIREAGMAEVTITAWGYDDTVRYASKMADEHGWLLVQDTSWPGYEEVPRYIVQGYTTMAEEAASQLDSQGVNPTHVFLQAGVGAMAGGVLGYLRTRYESWPPIVSIAEPEQVACVFQSALERDGEAHPARGSGETIMAGLNCGEPCALTWPVLRDQADFYFACPDCTAARGMRLLASPLPGDTQVISGESGAVTAGLLSLLLEKESLADMKKALGLNEKSVILLFSTEGDTDPEAYRRIVWDGAFPVPEK
ncbi:MAG: diaminopropionate ammonia-lyase [Candidatus Heteroscillospira sp.]